jgi:ATP-dependent RNA helicase RhlE
MPDIRKVVAALPTRRQSALFSATMPKEILHLAEGLLRDPVRVAIQAVASTPVLVEQSVHFVEASGKRHLLSTLLKDPSITRAIVFTRTKRGADRVALQLNQEKISATAMHGNLAQNARQRALDAFKSGAVRILVATDLAARGIDVAGVSHVFNYELPNEPESYVHRIGRTARNGAKGLAVAFCDATELAYLNQIEKLTGVKRRKASPRRRDEKTTAAPQPRGPQTQTPAIRRAEQPAPAGSKGGLKISKARGCRPLDPRQGLSAWNPIRASGESSQDERTAGPVPRWALSPRARANSQS